MYDHKKSLQLATFRKIFVIVILAIVFALMLPARFMELSFTCGFSKCENLGADTSYMVEDVSWQWLGGYHMSIWQYFTPENELQNHWTVYNYRGVDVFVLLVEALSLAVATTFILQYFKNKNKPITENAKLEPNDHKK